MQKSSRMLAAAGLTLLVAAVTTLLLTSRRHAPARMPAAMAEAKGGLRAGNSGARVLRIGYSALTPLHCALGEVLSRTDIMAKRGLQGEFKAFLRGKDQDQACAAGLVDATFSCEIPAMIHLDRHPQFMIVGSPGRLGDMALVAPAHSPVRSPHDLAGRRIQVAGGASAELILDAWLRRAGIGKDSVQVGMAPGNGAAVVRALADGRADAGVLWDPWLTQFVLQGKLRILAQATFWSVIFVDRRIVERSDDVLKRYLAAIGDAAGWIAQHPDETLAWTAERSGLPKEVVRTVLEKAGLTSTPAAGPVMGAELLERLRECEGYAVRSRQVSPEFRLSAHILAKDLQ